MRTFLLPLFALSLSACAAVPADPVASAPPAGESTGAPVAELVSAVDIPYEEFTLDNGLRVIVHTDRKAPIVGVTTYYRVGSKHEPRGRTGFAHLYEHLFFGGSANVPNFDIPLEAAGSTGSNGSTWYDRTNYIETVPTGALDLALFQESDRMGYILPAVTQDKLDKQRGVVQNEKRQGDNQPYGLAEYAIADGLFPVGHPYRHSTIGSMADLDAATLADVRTWFTDHYGPNNVVLVLSGDIDAATARPKVEKWFGAIPRGPEVAKTEAGPVTLDAPASREMADQVPVLRLQREWSAPGLNSADAVALEIGMRVLGGLASSRLDNALVRGQQLAVAVTASAQTHEQVGFLEATMDVKPGVDRAAAEAAFDAVITDYVAQGPNEDEVRRAVVSTVSSQIGALERVGGFSGKGATLAEGAIYSDDPAKYKKDLAAMAALTPARVTEALQTWLGRPVYKLAIVPGERTEDGATMGGWGDEGTVPAPKPDAKTKAPPLARAPVRTSPPVADVAQVSFPTIERAQLSNGIPVALARRTAVPKVTMAIDFDAGYAADAPDAPGVQAFLASMLEEGTTTLDATALAEAEERLGATIATGAALDSTSVQMTALTANLAPSLALMADIARNPAFADPEVARVKAQRIAEIAQAEATPQVLARRAIGGILYEGHPYAQLLNGLGTEAAIAPVTSAQLRAAHQAAIRPDLARITVVGDIAMETLLPLLETAFGDWTPPAAPPVAKDLTSAVPSPRPRIVLIDRPNSPQSMIFAGAALPFTGRTPDLEAVELANDVVGGGFLSRLNTDLREEKGWSYGVYSSMVQPVGPSTFAVSAPVQSDRTGDAIKAIRADIGAFPGRQALTDEELERVTEGAIRNLPNQFETNGQVLSAILANQRRNRPDDYYETLPERYRALGKPQIEAAAKRYLSPDRLVYVVVGDRKVVEPQLKGLGLPVDVRETD